MYAMVGHWIPAIERSRFMSSFQGIFKPEICLSIRFEALAAM
jgi:hypothetical protein